MEAGIKEEELYLSYQSNLRRLEQDMEEYQKKSKRFEAKKEDRKCCMAMDQEQVETMTAGWGEGADASHMRGLLEEYLVENQQELEKEERSLEEEHLQLRKSQQQYEETYQKELQDLQEVEG